MDLAEATLPADATKVRSRARTLLRRCLPAACGADSCCALLCSPQPSKQMRMGAKAAMPIKRVGARIFGAGGPGPAPAPAPSADAVEATGM